MNTKHVFLNALTAAFLMLLPFAVRSQTIEQPLSKAHASSFAIIIDKDTYAAAREEVLAYRRSLETRGLAAYIVSDNWQRPEQVRDVLKELYGLKPRLEGAVLVGDIPIPMIRDAQHLTSTFKMDQKIDWKRSSVPSDRFYDDFDLKFDFIKQDTTRKEYFYYSLAAGSPQHIEMDIYTARIKPPVVKGKSRTDQVKAYLKKAVGFDLRQNPLNQAMIYAGYGYHSESHNSWSGEQLALKEQIPGLYRAGGGVRVLNFRTDPHMKFQLLSEVQRPDLDLAIFHTHGDDVTQLINGTPSVSNPGPSIENIQRYLRSKIQSASDKKQDVEVVKKRFHESMGVPYAWMENALADSVRRADSLFDAANDIVTADLEGIRSNASFVLLDACDNGSFHLDDYIADHYAFGEGNTAVAYAATIGVLQDQWANQGIGLLALGIRAGNWLKQVAYLESHLFGDPTFTFAAGGQPDLNRLLAGKQGDKAIWYKLLKNPEADVQALALQRLASLQAEDISGLLKRTYMTSPHGVVRLQALYLLSSLNTPDFTEVLKLAVDDPYEKIRRIAANRIGTSGRAELLPSLVRLLISDRNSERVHYNAKNSLAFFDHKAVVQELKKQLKKQLKEAAWLYDREEFGQTLLRMEATSEFRFKRDYESIADTGKALKERRFSVRTMRAYAYHQAVPDVIRILLNNDDDLQLRVEAAEALSWFGNSYRAEEIRSACRQIMDSGSAPEVLKKQAFKTIRILGG